MGGGNKIMGHSIFKADYPLMQRWLNRRGYRGSINDMFDKYFKTLLGGGTGTVNNLAHTYFGSLGYTGDTGERLNSFFTRVMGINNPIEAQRAFFASDSTGFDIGAPSFEADFSTGVFDKRITFSRTTNATLKNAQGMLAYAPHNLLLQSNAFGNASWSKAASGTAVTPTATDNVETAPDGTMTASLVTLDRGAGNTLSDNARLYQAPSVSPNNTHNFAVWIKAYTASDVGKQVGVRHCAGISYGIITLTASWVQVFRTETGSSASMEIVSRGTITADNTVSFYLWRAQLNVGPLLDYVGTTTTDYYGPRLDYDASACVYTSNMYTYSEEVDNAAWTKSRATVTANVVTAPDGTMTADKLSDDTTPGGTYFFQSKTYIANTIYTRSIYAKKAELDTFAINWFSSTSWASDGAVVYNLTTGVATPSGTVIAYGMTDVGNGWYRCYATMQFGASSATTNYPAVQLSTSTLNGTDGLYIWGNQLHRGSALTDYLKTTNLPQIQLDSTSPAPVARGLLMEEQRTNLCLYSQDFSNAAWVAISAKNLNSNTVFAPDGTLTATIMTDSSAAVHQGVQQLFTVANDSSTYAISLYILKTTGGTAATVGINIALSGGTLVTNNARINTDTGYSITGTMEDTGRYWRFKSTITNNSTGNTTLAVSIYAATAVYGSYSDVVTATGSAVFWGVQVELGAFATSYIPTTSASVTRGVETATISGTNFSSWFNPTAGTVVSNFVVPPLVPLTYPYVFRLGNASLTQRTQHWINGSGTARCFNYNAGSSVEISFGAVTSGQSVKTAVMYSSAGIRSSLNGGSIGSDAGVADYSLFTAIDIGGIPGSYILNSTISKLAYYPSAMTDAQLQNITT